MNADPVNKTTTENSGRLALPGWLADLLRFILVAGLPLLLVLVNARFLMSAAFVRWEYTRPGFPEDSYGFSTAERLNYGSLGLAYLFNSEGPEFLGDLTFPDGSPLFNEREVSHMLDVKLVTQKLSRFGYGLLAIYALAVILLAISPDSRPVLYSGLFTGGLLTVSLIILGLIATVTSFNWLFTQFHGLFFQGDTWLFPTSDTLIRLYPERFWVDAFAFMFGGALLEGLVLSVVMWLLMKRKKLA